MISNTKILHLPNSYQLKESTKEKAKDDTAIRVGCFGAIRPMKNQLIQAVAAIDFANSVGKKLKFYINGTRIELTHGNAVLKNIRALFANSRHQLIEIPWLNHSDFLDFIKENIDIGMQVSFTETYNIVAADFVSQRIPVVVSSEIDYIHGLFKVGTTDMKKISAKLRLIYRLQSLGLIHNFFVNGNFKRVKKGSENSKKIWQGLFG